MVRALARHDELLLEKDRATVVRLARRQTRPRRLLLCLDGVPLEIIKAAKGRGLFENFGTPACLLSPFPTMTNIALSQMLGASAPLGYESLYFDREARELRGGVRKYIGWRTPDKVPSSYMDELDYQEPLAFEFLIYVAPEAVWRADMRRFRERFRRAPQHRDFFAFLKGTDGLLHIRGPERLNVALESLDRILREIQATCGRETEIVLFSDHGMNLQENRRIHLQSHLRRAGFEIAGRLPDRSRRRGSSGGGGRLSAPAFGLCGYAAVYCAEETDKRVVADALATLEGVDFSICRDDEGKGVIVKGARGEAHIERRENAQGKLYAYTPHGGDPLQLSAVRRAIEDAGQLDDDGFAPDSMWLNETAAHTYPDALANLYDSLYAPHVRHTADILVSLHDGYYYGAAAFSRLARLAATHGNALRPSTSAFLMSTHRTFPAYVRASEARPFLRE